MANYFVDSVDGSDSTGDGSATTPWKTLDKAIGSSPAITLPGSGATRVVVAPGVYREAVTLGLSPSLAAPLTITGDVDGSLFGAGGVAVPKTGLAELIAWSNDTSSMTASALAISGKSYVTLENLRVVGGSRNNSPNPGSAIDLDLSTNITIRDCELVGHFDPASNACVVRSTVSAGVSANIAFDRCAIVGSSDGQCGLRVLADEHSADYDAAISVTNCLFLFARDNIRIDKLGGSGGGFAQGIAITGCTLLGGIASGGAGVRVVGWGVASSPMVTVRLCVVAHCRIAVAGSDISQIDEDYNLLHSNLPRSNVAAGSHSVVGFPSINFGVARITGGRLRPFAEPLDGSLALAFGPRPAGLTVDIFGRERPDPCAAGCLERAEPPGGETPVAPVYIFQVEG